MRMAFPGEVRLKRPLGDGEDGNEFSRRSQGTTEEIKSREKERKQGKVLYDQSPALHLPKCLPCVIILTRTFGQQLPSINPFSYVLNQIGN